MHCSSLILFLNYSFFTSKFLKMKIIHYIPSIDRIAGGTSTYMQVLGKELGKLAEVHIITLMLLKIHCLLVIVRYIMYLFTILSMVDSKMRLVNFLM